jgi:hypothetical protein
MRLLCTVLLIVSLWVVAREITLRLDCSLGRAAACAEIDRDWARRASSP